MLALYERIEIIKECISEIRALREKTNIPIKQKIDVTLESEKNAKLFRSHSRLIVSLASLDNLKIYEKESKKIKDDLCSYFQETLVTVEASLFNRKKEIDVLKKVLISE